MARYKPSGPFNAVIRLMIPSYADSFGVQTKTFPAPEECPLIYGTFRTFGGTDRDVNGIYSVENTATVETWYRPDIRSDCRLYVEQTGITYEILGEPENIELRNQYMKIRVIAYKGGA